MLDVDVLNALKTGTGGSFDHCIGVVLLRLKKKKEKERGFDRVMNSSVNVRLTVKVIEAGELSKGRVKGFTEI